MDCTICHIVSYDATAFALVHEQVHREILDEENAVVSEGTTEQGVEHRVPCAIGDCTASVGLAALAELGGLSTESSLVNLAICGSAKRHAVALELAHGNRSLTCHVVDGVLVSKPVAALDSIIEVILPAVLVHVTQRSVDSALIC